MILEKINRISLVNRYLSNLEEFAAFFQLCKDVIDAEQQDAQSRSGQAQFDVCALPLRHRAKMESARAHSKIKHQRALCRAQTKQLETLVQIVSVVAPATYPPPPSLLSLLPLRP